MGIEPTGPQVVYTGGNVDCVVNSRVGVKTLRRGRKPPGADPGTGCGEGGWQEIVTADFYWEVIDEVHYGYSPEAQRREDV